MFVLGLVEFHCGLRKSQLYAYFLQLKLVLWIWGIAMMACFEGERTSGSLLLL